MTTLQTHVSAGRVPRHRRISAFLLAALVLAVPATVGVLALGWEDVPTQAPIAVLVALLLLLLYVGVRARVRRAGAEVDRQLDVVEGRSRAAADPPTLDEAPRVEVDPSAAEEFLEQFHAENPHAGPVAPRIAEVLREIDATGTYRHTADELSVRCAHRLAQQRALHRPAVLAEPAGPRPADRHRLRRRRRAVLRPPARRRTTAARSGR